MPPVDPAAPLDPAAIAPAPAATGASAVEGSPAAPTEPASAATGEVTKPAAEPAKAAAPEFAPSLLDEAADKGAKPDSAKPGDKPAGETEAKPTEAAKPAEGAKPSDAPSETPPAPITYEFTYPEGVKPEDVNSERMTAYTGILNEARVSPEVGQRLLDLHLGELTAIGDKLAQHQWSVFNETQKRWRDEVLADEQIGGNRHDTAMKNIVSLVDMYGGDKEERAELRNVLRTTGAANNPTLLRFLNRAAEALVKESTPHPSPPPRAPTLTGRDRGLARYNGRTA